MHALRILLFTALLQWGRAQQDFTVEPVPNPFTLGDRYPDREEEEVCRTVRDYIVRNSVRFTTELVTNVNSQIDFGTSDARIMTSRMQTRVNRLATLYGQRFTVLKAWTEFPDSDLTNERSLHYEGRTIRVSVNGLSNGQISDFLTTAVQAAFDWVIWEHQDYVRLSVIPDSCEVSVDLCWMLDQSGSVGEDNHDIAKEFIKNVVSFFTIGLDATRVGLVAYSTESHEEFDLDRRTTLNSLHRAIDRVDYRGGWTATALALDDARELLDPDRNNGARPDSQGVPKIAVLITDGKSNQHPIDLAAPALRDSGVQVYAIGIGNVDIDELKLIASDPDDEHVFILNSFNDAAGFVNLLSLTACETPAIINPCVDTVTQVLGGFIRYFQAECTTFSDTVVVELMDTTGTNYLYCSTVETNPGPLTDSTTADETMGVSTRTCTVDLSSASRRVIYMGVRGQEDHNLFTLTVFDESFFTTDAVDVNVLEGTSVPTDLYDLTDDLMAAASSLMLEYSIEEGNEGDTFALDAQTGTLSVQQDVSFDDTQSYSLLVNARNMNGDCCHRARITINVLVIRNRIDFPDTSPVDVSENALVGDEVTQFQASGGAGSLEYSITGGNTGGAFTVDPSTGTIEVASSLNFETVSDYNLTIHVLSVSISVEGDAVQRILVTDENERPSFITPCAGTNTCAFSIEENQSPGTQVGPTIEADDPDLVTTSNGMLQFRIADSSLPFQVSQAGEISTTQGLDREDQSGYSVRLIVEDMGDPSLSVETTIQVTVSDVNDIDPFFIEGLSVLTVAENAQNGFILTQYIAEDDDLGNNAVIEYSLTPQNFPFDLDPQNGVLTVNGTIDYEDVQEYMVTVTASNPDGLSSSVDVNITVIDLNDNSPVFSPNIYTDEVLEHSSIGTPVSTVSATDADSGSNGEIRYSITAGNAQNSFAIDDTSGEVTVNGDIDRETITSFSLTVRGRDLGSPQQSSFATVNVEVNDKNDNPPDFDSNSYIASLREDTQLGFDILTVFAFDPDEPGNPNSQIQYSISSGNTGSTFSLDSTTGLLELANSLDFENQESYTLEVVAEDQGDPTMSDTATVTIEVVDVNEFSPVLSVIQPENVSELVSTPIGITQVSAQDDDTNDVVTYSIASGNEEMKFSIDESTGQITLIEPLDFETTSSYELRISASDGQNADTGTLTVNVIDENEFAPEIFGDRNFEIVEEMPNGTFVGTVQARDGDGGPDNSRLTFTLVPGYPISQYFNLDPYSGHITTLGVLDREQLTQRFPAPGSSGVVEVRVQDGGQTPLQTTAIFTIVLVDINDNVPQFPGPYSGNVLEHTSPNVPVQTVAATDLDLGSNGELQYAITAGNAQNSFTIDTSTGVIRVNGDIDRETITSFILTVQARDGGSPQHSSITLVTIQVIDINDHPPQFNPDTYSAALREDTPIGVVILNVFAFDLDQAMNPNSQIEYSITEGNSDDAFSLNDTTGLLKLANSLDFERQESYRLEIVASDQGSPPETATATATIQVVNLNEFSPVFDAIPAVNVSELTSVPLIVTQVNAQDGDTGANITYSIISGNEDMIFTINDNTGLITLIQSLDYEAETLYELQVFASDGQKSDTATLIVNVIDENEFVPQFFGSRNYQIEEEMPAGTLVGTVQVSDGDTGPDNSRITYMFIQDVPITTYFHLNPDNGEIRTQQVLDREELTSIFPLPESLITVDVLVHDNGIPVLQNMDNITITLLDINDNGPVFSQDPYMTNVAEHSSIGTPVLTVSATDSDQGSNGEVLYTIIAGNTQNSFAINDSTGEITTFADIDRETIASFLLSIQARDSGNPQQSTTVSVDIQVLDINDHAPRFNPDTYSSKLREDILPGFTVLTVSAFDFDEMGNPNSLITYSITSGNINNTFSINSTEGILELANSLDFENQESYTLEVVAEDQGDPTMSDTTTVTIEVVNVNESPPVLNNSQTEYISELAPVPLAVTQFNAEDLDAGATITYSIVAGNSEMKFSMDESSGLITLVASLDYETTTSYELEVSASDGAGNDTATLTVIVIDENEFRPQFSGSTDFEVTEEMPSGTVVGTIQATDADGTLNNSVIIYTFVGGSMISQYFELNPTNGTITTTRVLDRDTLTQAFPQSMRSVDVSARDTGVPSLQNVRSITITILDLNDNAPMFSQDPYKANVIEHSSNGTSVLVVTATDIDMGSNSQVGYTIVSGNSENYFTIDANTGEIQVSGDIDREMITSFNLTVQATDMGSAPQSSSVRVEICVIDINDNAPVFDPDNYSEVLPENTPSGFILSVNATDIDEEGNPNSQIVYRITNGNSDGTFRLDGTTGHLELTNSLDFERQESYTLEVIASDQGNPPLSDTATITVQVTNLNEFAPVLNVSQTIDISELAPVPLVVAQFNAQDGDTDDVILYSIASAGNEEMKFSIDNTTGQVALIKSLDFETTTSYQLLISASDGDKMDTARLTVNVIDKNEFEPEFFGTTNFEIEEEMPNGTFVGTVQALDRDGGPDNSRITFLFQSQIISRYLSIDRDTGNITTLGKLDREELTQVFPPPGSSRSVEVSARDGGSPSLQSIVTITITLLDINDNDPVFSQDPFTVGLIEHLGVGSTIITTSATDLDLGTNGELRYMITDGNTQESFAINDTTGEITIAKDIDRETIPTFNLTIRAEDMGSPQRSNSTIVLVTVNDINDNAPVFDPDNYNEVLPENTPSGFILSVNATDIDEEGNPNSQIVYRITSGNSDGTFRLDNTTGHLELVNSLDFERQKSYTLEVIASDQGNPPLSDTATITIQVTNLNEFAPVLNVSQTIDISELAPVPLVVTQFNAQDGDTDDVITYSIASAGNEEMKFSIDNTTGQVALIEWLDFETTTSYQLLISASDGDKMDTARLTVNVIDENEFTPEFFGITDSEIVEEMPNGTFVGTVQARDRDGGPVNSKITFSFVQGQAVTQYFNLDRDSGNITTRQTLDREELTQVFPPSESSRSIEVSVSDSGMPSHQNMTTITVTLMDINDNAPQFSDDSYANMILENLQAQTLIFQVSATDIDLGSNADIRFSFEVNDSVSNVPQFEIDDITGLIQTTAPLDREQQEVYMFIITVTDLGDPALNSSVEGILTVLDENDNAPVFTTPMYEITIPESVRSYELNLEVHADDPDKDLNGEVRYLLIGQGDPGFVVENDFAEETLFEIDIITGVLQHITPFNYELQTDFNLTIVAHDLGAPRRSSSAKVIIHLTNIDESPPFFPEVNCHAEIPEDHPVNTVVRSCIAEDPDNITTSPDQVGIFYSLLDGFGVFDIKNTTGEITTIAELDYDQGESFQVYFLSIFAIDLIGQFGVTQSANIQVTDVNDNTPRFINAPYFYAMSSGRLRNYVREISVVEAEDDDSGNNARIVFSIESIAYHGETETVIGIMAMDEGLPPRHTSTTLTVTYQNPCLLQSYAINPLSGVVTVDALCSVAVGPLPEANIVLGGRHTVFCSVIRNGPTSFQWIHNGSTITASADLALVQQQAEFTITEARFEDAGGYACKVTTAAGSLQSSPESIVNIRVPPRITVPPRDAAVAEGESVEFSCSAVGIPHPTIQWLFKDGVISTEAVLSIQEVEEEDEGSYTCVASSSAGEAEASVTLTLFETTDEVEVTLGGVNNPNEDGSCHYFDVDGFQDLLTELTGQTTMVTGVSSDAVCDQSACSPNPCMNGGSCELNQDVDGGYECFCRNGYTGTDCETDIDECRPENPCGTGSCFNVLGSYFCECPSGRLGGRCQYIDSCSNGTRCNASQDCINSLSSLDGYVCQMELTDHTRFLVIRVTSVIAAQRLEDLILGYIEDQQQAAAASGKRKRRQTVDDSLVRCEPRFTQLNDTHYALRWICPDGVDPPSDSVQADICDVLLDSGSVETCQPPNGVVLEPPTNPPLPDADITIEFVQVDPETNEPVDAGEVLDILDETDAVENAAGQLGSSVEEEPQVSVPVTCVNGVPDGRGRCTCEKGWTGITCEERGEVEEEPTDNSDNSDSTEVIIGAVVGGVVFAILVAVVILAFVIGVKKYKAYKRRQEAKRIYAHQLSVLSNPGARNHEPVHQTPSTMTQQEENDYDELRPHVPPRPTKPEKSTGEKDYENIWKWPK